MANLCVPNLKGETKFKKFIKSIPMATCGISLALAALGNVLQAYFGAGNNVWVRDLCGVLSFAVLLVFALKLAFDMPHAREELKTPVPASVLPTTTMAIMLLATYLLPYMPVVATAAWWTAVVAHVCLMVYFFRKFILVANFSLSNIFPSIFIVLVGIVTASVTAPAMGAAIVGQAAFYIGFALYFLGLPLVITRMNKVKTFLEPARPTIAIFTAPMSLLIVGYFNSFSVMGNLATISREFIYVMLAIAAISYLYVLVMTPFILRKRFYTSYSAFTFPLVISALAFRLGANFLMRTFVDGDVVLNESLSWLTTVADVTMWIAVAAVAFVIVTYVRYFIKMLKY